MYGRCETDPFDQAIDVCNSCYGEFCDSCLVKARGRRHRICKECALIASGVRAGARPLIRGSKKTAKRRRKALRDAPSEQPTFEYFDSTASARPGDPQVAMPIDHPEGDSIGGTSGGTPTGVDTRDLPDADAEADGRERLDHEPRNERWSEAPPPRTTEFSNGPGPTPQRASSGLATLARLKAERQAQPPQAPPPAPSKPALAQPPAPAPVNPVPVAQAPAGQVPPVAPAPLPRRRPTVTEAEDRSANSSAYLTTPLPRRRSGGNGRNG